MIVIDKLFIDKAVLLNEPQRITLSVWDHGDVYNSVSAASLGAKQAEGVVCVCDSNDFAVPANASVKVEVTKTGSNPNKVGRDQFQHIGDHTYLVRGYVRQGQQWDEHEVEVTPVQQELFSRHRGLLETDVLAGAKVFLKGLGSVGSTVARLLAQCGVGEFYLMDHDRLSAANVNRHEGGLSYIGRRKPSVMADLIHEKNPDAKVHTFEEKLDEHNMELARELVHVSTLCIDTGDQRKGKLLLNRLCLEENRTLIVSGCFRRAYGGQVLRVRPWKAGCYACFCRLLTQGSGPTDADYGIQTVAYADRPVPVEPGLSIDIEPISHMTAKVAMQELLAEIPTTLRRLDQDLEANLYLWLSRREQGTQYESLEPLGYGLDGMRILRWYGIDFARNPACPTCGDFATGFAAQEGISVTAEDVAAFFDTCKQKGAIRGN